MLINTLSMTVVLFSRGGSIRWRIGHHWTVPISSLSFSSRTTASTPHSLWDLFPPGRDHERQPRLCWNWAIWGYPHLVSGE